MVHRVVGQDGDRRPGGQPAVEEGLADAPRRPEGLAVGDPAPAVSRPLGEEYPVGRPPGPLDQPLADRARRRAQRLRRAQHRGAVGAPRSSLNSRPPSREHRELNPGRRPEVTGQKVDDLADRTRTPASRGQGPVLLNSGYWRAIRRNASIPPPGDGRECPRIARVAPRTPCRSELAYPLSERRQPRSHVSGGLPGLGCDAEQTERLVVTPALEILVEQAMEHRPRGRHAGEQGRTGPQASCHRASRRSRTRTAPRPGGPPRHTPPAAARGRGGPGTPRPPRGS